MVEAPCLQQDGDLCDEEHRRMRRAKSLNEKRMYERNEEFLDKLKKGEPIDPDLAAKDIGCLLARKELDDEKIKPEELDRRTDELGRNSAVVRRMVKKLKESIILNTYRGARTVERLENIATNGFQDAEVETGLFV